MSLRIEIPALGGAELEAEVVRRWNSLTKPPGSLGRLETLVTRLALMQNTPRPSVARKLMVICCADFAKSVRRVKAVF